MDKILDLAKKYDLEILEDCSQSHFAKYKNAPLVLLVKIMNYSFYPSKNLTVFGDGGIVTTNNTGLIKIKLLEFKMIMVEKLSMSIP